MSNWQVYTVNVSMLISLLVNINSLGDFGSVICIKPWQSVNSVVITIEAEREAFFYLYPYENKLLDNILKFSNIAKT